MRISLIQNNIVWEDKQANLSHYEHLFSDLYGKTDLVVLPEMCTTGFSMQSRQMAETNDGNTIRSFQCMAEKFHLAIAGSFIGKTEREPYNYFNRGFFICPDGQSFFYDKRHLFRMGEEPRHYHAGNNKCVVNYLGWNIRLVICYDLRFPVWCRNAGNEYDLLIVVANWPEARAHAWQCLLTARAIENMAYVCGVNRVGTDGLNISYQGDSQLIDAYGKVLSSIEPGREQIQTLEIDKEALDKFRKKFPVWKDADRFEIR